jgi:hypothetical protein
MHLQKQLSTYQSQSILQEKCRCSQDGTSFIYISPIGIILEPISVYLPVPERRRPRDGRFPRRSAPEFRRPGADSRSGNFLQERIVLVYFCLNINYSIRIDASDVK